MDIQFPAPLVEKTVLFLLNCVGTLIKYQLTIYVRVYFRTLSSIPLTCMSVSMAHCLDFCSFVSSFETEKCMSSNTVLLFQDSSGYSGFLAFPYKFYNQLFDFCREKKKKSQPGTLIRIVLNL